MFVTKLHRLLFFVERIHLNEIEIRSLVFFLCLFCNKGFQFLGNFLYAFEQSPSVFLMFIWSISVLTSLVFPTDAHVTVQFVGC